jgi:hypothetical protein
MRFMILVNASEHSEAGILPAGDVATALADYFGQMAEAGVLVDVNGLQPSAKGWRIEWSGGRKIVTDGPFAETKELIAGYTIIDVPSREAALEWAGRFPCAAAADGAVEVRQIYRREEFGDLLGFPRQPALQAADSNK